MNEASTSSRGAHEFDIFVSYATADTDSVMNIVSELKDQGLKCWMAPRDIRPGEEFGAEIIRGIRSSANFIVFLSHTSVRSRHVRAEVERAVTAAKPMYPVRLSDVEIGEALEFFLSIHQWVDIFDDPAGDSVKRLADAIKSGAPPESIATRNQTPKPLNWIKPAIVAGGVMFALLVGFNWVSSWLTMRSFENAGKRAAEDIQAEIEKFQNQTTSAVASNKIDIEDIEIELANFPNGIQFRLVTSDGWISTNPYTVHIGDAEPVPLTSNSFYRMQSLEQLLVKEIGTNGRVKQTRDMTSDLTDVFVAQARSNLANATSDPYWTCTVGGCEISESVDSGALCNPFVQQVEISQLGRKTWAKLDRTPCDNTTLNARANVCTNFQDFPFEIEYAKPFLIRFTMANGEQETITKAPKSDIQRFGFRTNATTLEGWTVLEPIKERNPAGPVPTTAIAFQPAGVVVGGFTLETAMDTCYPDIE
jgi:hypothetical protein